LNGRKKAWFLRICIGNRDASDDLGQNAVRKNEFCLSYHGDRSGRKRDECLYEHPFLPFRAERSIEYRELPPEIRTTRRVSELLRGLFVTSKNLTVLDEGALFAAASMGTSTKVRWLKALIFTIGKLDSAVVIIAQDKGSVVPSIRSTLVSYEIKIIKSSDSSRRAEISIMPQELTDEEQEPIHIDTWFNLKPTTLTFDSRAVTKFEFDIDIEEFFNRISEFNSLDAIAEAPRILDEMLSEKNGGSKKKEKAIKETILDILAEDNDLNDKEIQIKAHELGVKSTRSHIGQIRRERKVQAE
jgi:hypothetical protein